jgi:hypothetical protein
MELVLFWILLVCTLVGLSLHFIFLRKLRIDHPQTWVALGKPSLFLNNSIGNNLTCRRFLNKREYIDLNDASLTKLCNSLRVLNNAYLVFFIIVVISVIASWNK